MKFTSKRHELEGDIRQDFARAMEDTVGQADENAPRNEGTLAGSITWAWMDKGFDRLRARFGSSLRYARIRELGGTIHAVRAKRLVWRGRDGRFHSAVSVTQAPGGRKGSAKHGKRYLKPAAERFGEFYARHARSHS